MLCFTKSNVFLGSATANAEDGIAYVQAPDLLNTLFAMGTGLLIEKLPEVWSGEAEKAAVPQDDACVTHAAKMSKQDGLLDFSQPAETLHNKVRYVSLSPVSHA
jgi:methionyl-tRNA formyltransferase